MRLRYIYLLLCVLGLAFPYSQFIPFLLENGLDFRLFFQQLSANRISSFFSLDVLVSAVVLIVFIISEGIRLKIRHLWLPIVGTFAVGVSLGLPLFLYIRQSNLDKASNEAS
jgi:hypothetical protein